MEDDDDDDDGGGDNDTDIDDDNGGYVDDIDDVDGGGDEASSKPSCRTEVTCHPYRRTRRRTCLVETDRWR